MNLCEHNLDLTVNDAPKYYEFHAISSRFVRHRNILLLRVYTYTAVHDILKNMFQKTE